MTSRESTDSEKVQVPVLGPEKSHDPLEVIKEGRDKTVRHPRSSFVPGLCPLLQFLITRSLQEARGPACDFLPLHTPSLLSPSRAALVPIFSIGENDMYDQVENSPFLVVVVPGPTLLEHWMFHPSILWPWSLPVQL